MGKIEGTLQGIKHGFFAGQRHPGRRPDVGVGVARSHRPCAHGGAGAIAAALLQNAGLEVLNLAGGYGAWAKEQGSGNGDREGGSK